MFDDPLQFSRSIALVVVAVLILRALLALQTGQTRRHQPVHRPTYVLLAGPVRSPGLTSARLVLGNPGQPGHRSPPN